MNFDLIFDNAGGITLQTVNYCHYYNKPEECAADITALCTFHTTSNWDGNEPEHRKSYNNDGYFWLSTNTKDVWHDITETQSNAYSILRLRDLLQKGKIYKQVLKPLLELYQEKQKTIQ